MMKARRNRRHVQSRSEVTSMSEVTAVMNDLRTVIFDAMTWQDKVAEKAGIKLPGHPGEEPDARGRT